MVDALRLKYSIQELNLKFLLRICKILLAITVLRVPWIFRGWRHYWVARNQLVGHADRLSGQIIHQELVLIHGILQILHQSRLGVLHFFDLVIELVAVLEGGQGSLLAASPSLHQMISIILNLSFIRIFLALVNSRDLSILLSYYLRLILLEALEPLQEIQLLLFTSDVIGDDPILPRIGHPVLKIQSGLRVLLS